MNGVSDNSSVPGKYDVTMIPKTEGESELNSQWNLIQLKKQSPCCYSMQTPQICHKQHKSIKSKCAATPTCVSGLLSSELKFCTFNRI